MTFVDIGNSCRCQLVNMQRFMQTFHCMYACFCIYPIYPLFVYRLQTVCICERLDLSVLAFAVGYTKVIYHALSLAFPRCSHCIAYMPFKLHYSK